MLRRLAPFAAPVVGLAALLQALHRAGQDGLWYDEAYVARLARLDFGRCVQGALQDVHPPGWPMIAWAFGQLPIDPTLAIRLPSSLAFAALAALLARRHPLAGLALLFHLPLIDQAAQGRAYSALALGLVGVAMLAERGQLRWAGLLGGFVAALHGLAPLLVPVVLLAGLPWSRVRGRELAAGAAAMILPQLWWMPAFVQQALRYTRDPWYLPSPLVDGLTVSDGALGLALLLVGVGLSLPASGRRLLAPLALLVMLLGLSAAGLSLELHKTGVLVPGLILLALAHGPRATVSLGLATVGFLLSTRPIDPRPDLNLAADRIRALPAMPLLTWFAGEARLFLPSSMWSGRAPEDTATRLARLATEHELGCVAVVNMWNSAPFDEDLSGGLRLVAWAPVPGLDVRLYGGADCSASALPEGWVEGSPCLDEEAARWLCPPP